MNDPIRIVQLSDTHFLEDGAEPEGGVAYNTDEAFEAVFDHIGKHENLDLVVVTGDVADHGRLPQYQKAAEAFSRLPGPVNVIPGNHDQDAAFAASMGRPSVSTSRVIKMKGWAFLFVDSSAGNLVIDKTGRAVDPPNYADRLHSDGHLGAAEAAWIRDMVSQVEADHVFIWVHHPPGCPIGMLNAEAYNAEWAELLRDLPSVRGVGAGHTHAPDTYEFMGRTIHVAPSFKNNFDLVKNTWLPPGYRSYTFEADGTVKSQERLVDDPRWPRRPFGRALRALFDGELTFDELRSISERKASKGD
ncbi:MAG: hypothetical protein CBC48_13340 [bacterium TMED88]|nr:hypothetical protein [Deltaproteobacteria bacterium]OUV28355.1 MAG: hypothetical protein CBC48_13340 [bacterium TMED88]